MAKKQLQGVINPLYNGGLVRSDYGNLPEFGFGSWLGDRAGGILKTAGSIITAIPGFGTIAGPVIAGLGGLTDSLVSGAREKKAGEQAVSDTQLALDEQAASEKEQQGLMNLNIKRQNLQDKTVNYGATFEKGGQIGAGFTGQPQIVEYENGEKHDKSAVGGIPVDARGNPATTSNQSAVGLTEKGEVTWNGYVFSDKLKT